MWGLRPGGTSSEGPQLAMCLRLRCSASCGREEGWLCRWTVSGYLREKRAEGHRRFSLLRPWDVCSCRRKAEDSSSAGTVLSNVHIKSVKGVFGNNSIIFKSHLICVRDLLFFPSHWVFVLHIQIPWTIQTIRNPLFRWHFQSYKQKSYEMLKTGIHFSLPNNLLKRAMLLFLKDCKVDKWIRVSWRWLGRLLTFFNHF